MGRKKKVSYNYSTEEEAKQASALEDFLFGGGSAVKLLATGADDARTSIADLVKQAEAAGSAASDDDEAQDDQDLLFVEDRLGDAATEDDDEQEQQQQGSDADGDADEEGAAGPGPGSMALQQQHQRQRGTKRGRAPVWVDPSDAAVSVPVASVARLRKLRQYKGQSDMTGEQYEAALRRQHTILNPRTTWAAAKPSAASSKSASGAVAGGAYVIDEEHEPDESSAQQLLLSGSGLLLQGGAAAGGLLAPGSIELSRLRDANGVSPSDAVVQALQFHPNGQLMLTGGFDKRLKLFQVDGLRNPLVQSLFLEDCPIHTAAFAGGSGGWVVAAGRRPFYYVADLNTGQLERVVTPPCINLAPSGAPSNEPAFSAAAAAAAGGNTSKQHKSSSSSSRGGARWKSSKGSGSKGSSGMKSCESFVVSPEARSQPLVAFLGDNGHIGLVSLGSRSSVGALKMNGSARAAAFSSDGNTLISAGGDGVVYTWDLRSQRCLHQQRDEGVVSCTSLALSPDNSYLATGDSMGVVNIYSRPAGLLAPLLPSDGGDGVAQHTATPSPLKTLMNLTTAVDSLAFSHDSQLLMMGSRLKKESLRLVHMPSLTVYQNWPTSKSPLQYVHCAAFSPHSGFLGIGNAKGRVLLYRLHHYPSV